MSKETVNEEDLALKILNEFDLIQIQIDELTELLKKAENTLLSSAMTEEQNRLYTEIADFLECK